MNKKNILTILMLSFCILLTSNSNVHTSKSTFNGVNIQRKVDSSNVEQINETEDIDTAEEIKYKKGYRKFKNAEYVSPALSSSNSSNNKDIYENNNSVDDAYILHPFSKSKPQDFSITLEALITQDPWYYFFLRKYDEDYYQIDIQGNASLEILLTNISLDCDYDIEVFKNLNEKGKSKKNVERITNNYEGCRGKYGEQECFKMPVIPGSYYIRVFTPIEKCDENNKYKLHIKCKYDFQNNESISNLRFNKGCKCALWKSDYDPYQSVSNSGPAKIQVDYTQPTLPHNNSFFERYILDVAKEETLFSELYIWDRDACRNVSEELCSYSNELKKEKSELDTKIRILLDLEDLASNAGNGIGISLGIASLANPSSALLSTFSFASSVLFPAASCLIQNAIPSGWELTLKEFINYLDKITALLKYISLDDNTNKVITISKKYHRSSEIKPVADPILYFDYLTISINLVTDNILTMESYITSYRDNYILGHIYGIRNQEDYKNAISGIKYSLDDVNTSEIIDFNKNNVENLIYNELLCGQYTWYKFTAPETAMYDFQTYGDTDTYGEIFSSVVPGQQNTNRIVFNDDHESNKNFFIRYEMKKDSTIYIRVRGHNYSEKGKYYFKISKNSGSFEILPEEFKLLVGKNCARKYYNETQYCELITKEGEKIHASRLRCTYLGQDNIVLSANKKGAGTAFLRLQFERPISGIYIDLSLWGENEQIDSSNCSIELRHYDEAKGKYTISIDVLKDRISTDRNNPSTIYTAFADDKTHIVELVVSMKNPSTETTNKGRVAIKRMKIFY